MLNIFTFKYRDDWKLKGYDSAGLLKQGKPAI